MVPHPDSSALHGQHSLSITPLPSLKGNPPELLKLRSPQRWNPLVFHNSSPQWKWKYSITVTDNHSKSLSSIYLDQRLRSMSMFSWIPIRYGCTSITKKIRIHGRGIFFFLDYYAYIFNIFFYVNLKAIMDNKVHQLPLKI